MRKPIFEARAQPGWKPESVTVRFQPNAQTMRNDVINMSWVWDKEKIWVPNRNWPYGLLHTGRMLYPLSYEGKKKSESFFSLSHPMLLITSFLFSSLSLKFTIFLYLSHTWQFWHCWSLQYAGHMSHMNLVYGPAHHKSFVP